MMGILNDQLGREVRIALQTEVVTGDSSGNHLNGFLHRVTQTQAKSTDATPDAIYKAMTLIRYTGRAEPDGIIMHPNDWQDIQLLKDQIGHYIWGDPSNGVSQASIWGLPVIVNTSETQNTALVGAFRDYSTLYMREELTVETGYVDTDFTKAQKTVRAVLRAALQVRRLNAFCTVTGI
jgi:HK97 family phage major capsid protein